MDTNEVLNSKNLKNLSKNYQILQSKYEIINRKSNLQQSYLENHEIFRQKLYRIINLDDKIYGHEEKIKMLKKAIERPVEVANIDFGTSSTSVPKYCQKCLKYLPNLLILLKILESYVCDGRVPELKNPGDQGRDNCGTDIIQNVQNEKVGPNPIFHEIFKIYKKISYLEPAISNLVNTTQPKITLDLIKLVSTTKIYTENLSKIFSTNENYKCQLKSTCQNYKIMNSFIGNLQNLSKQFLDVLRNPSDEYKKIEFYGGFKRFYEDDRWEDNGNLVKNCHYEEYKMMKKQISEIYK